MKNFNLERVLWELLLIVLFVLCAWFLMGCDVNTDPNAPLPFPKNYVPKNPPVERPAPRPTPPPREPEPLGVGDRVKVTVGNWATTRIANGVIVRLRLLSEADILFVDNTGAPTILTLPLSLITRE